MQKKLIIYIIIIIIILAGVFLSQQAYSRAIGKNLISAANNQASAYMAKGSEWVASNVLQKIGVEVQKRGDAITNEVNQTKQKVSEDVGKKIENYFSGIANSITGKNNNNCPTQPHRLNKL